MTQRLLGLVLGDPLTNIQLFSWTSPSNLHRPSVGETHRDSVTDVSVPSVKEEEH